MNRFALATLFLALAAGSALAATGTSAARKKPAHATRPAPEPVLAPADADQLKAAGMVLVGDYGCEDHQAISVRNDAAHDGYVDVTFGKQHWLMKPVLSSTGALRMEDVRGQTLLLQIAYKSMLMDVKGGHRMVDDCVHEKQAALRRQNEAQATGAPAGSLLR